MSDTENNVSEHQDEPMEGSEEPKGEDKVDVRNNGEGGPSTKEELGAGDAPDKGKKSSPRKPKKKPVASEEDNDEEEAEDEEETKLGLLEQPTVLEAGRKRERKKVERMEIKIATPAKDKPKLEVEEGNGEKLGEIPRVEFKIGRLLADDLKPLHRLMFGRVGSSHEIKKNIRKFSGFTFDKESSDYEKKQQQLYRMPMTMIKMICETLDLERSGPKEKVVDRLLEFLLKPKSSGKALPKKRKRSSTGGKSKEKRKRRTKKDISEKKSKKSKKSKEDEDSEADDDNDEEDASDEEVEEVSDKAESGEEEEEQEDEEEDSDSDVAPKKKKARKESPKQESPKKTSPKKSSPKKEPKKETKKAKDAKKKPSPKKSVEKKPKKKTVIESSSDDDSSDDEPLVAKKKAPTDEELRDVIKKILDHANLEEVTMKTVFKQVYAKYPDFDLTSRKDFIKTTVKQIIR